MEISKNSFKKEWVTSKFFHILFFCGRVSGIMEKLFCTPKRCVEFPKKDQKSIYLLATI
jgi:hypothetical protein